MEISGVKEQIVFVDKNTNSMISIYRDSNGILYFASSLSNCEMVILCTHILHKYISKLYQATVAKYYMEAREHSRRYVFGGHSLITPPDYTDGDKTISWYSVNTFNQFHQNDNFDEIKIQSFQIESQKSQIIIRYIDMLPKEEFCILPNNLTGQYRPHQNRGSQDFYEDLNTFYDESLVLARKPNNTIEI